jgi:uncharacterized protein YdeI (YjbR/CyaY-like superfamily)
VRPGPPPPARALPPELDRAFARSKKARATFEAFTPSTKRRLVEWIQSARRPETRVKRADETVRMAKLGVAVNLWPK